MPLPVQNSKNILWPNRLLVAQCYNFYSFTHSFSFELYFEPYLIGTMISWSLDLDLIWSLDHLLIISLDHILSDRWSYLTDDLMFPYISSTCARHILWILLTCFRHVLDMAYACHSFPMLCISCTQHVLLMTYTCFTYDLHIFYLWLTHVRLAAYMLTLLYKPSIDDCTL